MQTKTKLTPEQTQQGVSDEVLISYGLNIRVIFSIHSDDGNPSRANIKQALWGQTTLRGRSLLTGAMKSTADIRKIKMEQAGKQQETKYNITSSDKPAVKEFDQKRTLFETMTKSKSFDKNLKHKALYHALMESILEDEDAMDKGVANKLKKRKPDDADRDETLLLDQTKGTTKSQPKSTGKSAQAAETMFEAKDTQLPQNLGEDMGKAVNDGPTQNWLIYNLLKGSCKSYVELEYNMEECYKAMNDQLDWSNPKGDRYSFDLSKPLPLVKSRNRLIVLADYFFNNDLAYLQGGSTDRTYTTSLTKMKAAKHTLLGTSHWRSKRQTFYGYASNKVSKHDVYSTKRILAVTNVKINKWYGYGHLEEIEVRRVDKQLYKFMEGDFLRIHLNDIEDMLLLVVQNKLFNLNNYVIVDLAVALHMFTRHPQGVIYEDKLNRKRLMRSDELHKFSDGVLHTLLDPQGVIYKDKLNRKRLMCSDELYKFSDGTLQLVRDTLHDMETNLRMGYNKAMLRRRWSNLDKTRSHILVKDIDRQLWERRLMRSLEKFVGGREYGEDLRLL
ncbi:hypothetical protein Tco_1069112 [Tanacetum coccineum]|uniref:Uncharacterized protein n=1 Tax=Tanacetum coccineum TaxID=301880 RepID=A0ABQ5HHK4_9ASTR